MLRAELEPAEIGVSVLCPGVIASNLVGHPGADAVSVRYETSSGCFFDQPDTPVSEKHVAHGSFQKTAGTEQRSGNRHRQIAAPATRRHQGAIKAEGDLRHLALVQELVQARKNILHVAPAPLEQGVKHLTLGHPATIGDGVRIMVALEQGDLLTDVGKHLRGAHAGNAPADDDRALHCSISPPSLTSTILPT